MLLVYGCNAYKWFAAGRMFLTHRGQHKKTDNCVDGTVQLISLKENCCMLIQISLMFICKGLIINKSAVV